MKRKIKPKTLLLNEDRDQAVASLATALAWSALSLEDREALERRARRTIAMMRRQAGGRT